MYINRHNEIAGKAMEVVNFVEQSSLCQSLEVGDYLKAIEDLHAMQFGFKDVELLLFNPELNSLLNLVGLHYCISWLQVPVYVNFTTMPYTGLFPIVFAFFSV